MRYVDEVSWQDVRKWLFVRDTRLWPAELGSLLAVLDAQPRWAAPLHPDMAGEPPVVASPGRTCLLCPTALSRYNPGSVCGQCEAASRDTYPPLVADGRVLTAKEREAYLGGPKRQAAGQPQRHAATRAKKGACTVGATPVAWAS